MQALQGSVSLICADAAKSYLRHGPDSSSSSSQRNVDHEVYDFLAKHFEQAAETKRRERKLSITKSEVAVVMQWLRQAMNSNNKEKEKKELEHVFKTEEPSSFVSKVCQSVLQDTPRVSQRDVTNFLESQNVNTAAMPEVLEMCRALQQLMQNKAKSSVSVGGFATTNCLHFASIFASLILVKSLFEMLSGIIDGLFSSSSSSSSSKTNSSNNNSSAILQMMCVCWSLIDPDHANVWFAVCKVYSNYPGMTTPLLLELFPSIESIGFPGCTFVEDVEEKFAPSSSSASSSSSSAIAEHQHVVSYNPEDEAPAANKSQQGKEQEGEEGDEDPEEAKVRNDFWSNLTAPQN